MTPRDSAPRGEANKIDWTKPLRVVGTHERAKVREIDPTLPYPVRLAIETRQCPPSLSAGTIIHTHVRSDGTSPAYSVENIPPEPRIVERWCAVRRLDFGAGYQCVGPTPLHDVRPSASPIPGTLIAKLLIEETD